MRRGFIGLLLCVAMGACTFEHGAAAPILVDFASSMSLQDHKSGEVMIPVDLSMASKEPVFVGYSVGGTAVAGVDYDVKSDPMLAFAPGTTQTFIVIDIHYTATEGPDTTVELSLEDPNGASLGKTAMHVMTISGVILPRVTFDTPASAAPETMDQMVNVVLDQASPVGTSVDLQLGGTAVQGVDYMLGPGTLVFPAGQTTYPLDLGVKHDSEYNSDVTVDLTLANPSKLIIGTPGTHTHTINETDPMPTVSFAQNAANASEAVGSPVMVDVTLSAASRQPVTVPFSVDGANTTANPGDYSITPSPAQPLTFAPGQTTQTISITLVDDGTADPTKTLAIALGTPTGATLGTPKAYTLSIQDADQTCTGTGAYQVCVQKPSAPVTLTGTLDTGTSPKCMNPFSGWASGQPAACFVVGTQITVTGTLAVTGSKPLVLLASDTITVSGTIDASSHLGGTTGPGAPFGTCAGQDGSASSNGGGGGAGGSFITKGGNGSNGNGANGGNAASQVSAPSVLRAGCNGHVGGDGAFAAGPLGGAGGVVYLVAVNGITLMSGSVIDASGAGGSAPGSASSAGGSGGGSGGMIKLDAPTITASGAIVMANGGGGASGACNNANGNDGSDPSTAAPSTEAPGGPAASQSGAGGNGGAGSGDNGKNGQGTTGSNKQPGGSGGGGGGGYVEASAVLTGATVVAGSYAHP